jgi:starch phosphorylase
MKNIHPLAGAPGGFAFTAAVPSTRPASDYTARIIPRHDGAANPLEAPRILWHH